ncbi:hypothetical protein M9H77_30994 [Catharanthus roseus]|uniref:Uncharacterized protein n=1 Tax=Catharanthus roseus TaxID=4058 RepID=A0ACC0A1G9_CATRO|nr:hypothetical protein M9H77_30994 [Catharanthus roseus]
MCRGSWKRLSEDATVQGRLLPEIRRLLSAKEPRNFMRLSIEVSASNEVWDLFENLSDNSQQHATFSRVSKSRQIGNRGGMYEVTQKVNLSLKVDALSKKFDQLLALNILPTISSNVRSVCAICSSPSYVIYDCPSASPFPEFVQEQVNSAQGFHRQNNPHSDTYNPG